MVGAGVVQATIGLEVAQQRLEDIATPITAEEGEEPAEDAADRPHASGPLRPDRAARASWSQYPVSRRARVPVDTHLEREVESIARALENHGPQRREDLGRLVGARYWGPRRFTAALRAALAQGRIRRAGRNRFEPASGAGGAEADRTHRRRRRARIGAVLIPIDAESLAIDVEKLEAKAVEHDGEKKPSTSTAASAYEGLVRNADRTYTAVESYTGVEVKSGTALSVPPNEHSTVQYIRTARDGDPRRAHDSNHAHRTGQGEPVNAAFAATMNGRTSSELKPRWAEEEIVNLLSRLDGVDRYSMI